MRVGPEPFFVGPVLEPFFVGNAPEPFFVGNAPEPFFVGGGGLTGWLAIVSVVPPAPFLNPEIQHECGTSGPSDDIK